MHTRKEKRTMWIKSNWLVQAAAVALLLVTLTACGIANPAVAGAADSVTTGTSTDGRSENVTRVDVSGNTGLASVTLSDVLSDTEVEGLLYMREEEKLARDVYLTLYDKWGLGVFQNISGSEQAHMDAVKSLLDRYGLEDPAAGNEIGVFTNLTLQALYDQLVEEGSQSLADALRVGAAIEEIDILDLEERIAQTDKGDIQQVYDNLMMGSSNHLRAFVSNPERQTGETYQPQYLDQTAYESIVNSPMGRGRGRSF
jgi:hypothetical protein